MIVEAEGGPLGVVVAGANVDDFALMADGSPGVVGTLVLSLVAGAT